MFHNRGTAHHHRPGFTDCLPPRASTQMRCQRPVDCIKIINCCVFRSQTFKATNDARRAESALAAAGGQQRVGPTFAIFFRQSINCCNDTTSNPANWRYAGNSWSAVNQDGATPALSLRITTCFGRTNSESTAQCRQQRHAIVGNAHFFAINDERDLRNFD